MAKKTGSLDDIADLIDDAMDRKRVAVIALCKYYAGKALKEFRVQQGQEKFWTNRTFTAYDTVFSDAIRGQGDEVGWYLAHQIEYGIYLEKKTIKGKIPHALRAVVNALQPKFFEDLKKIYAG